MLASTLLEVRLRGGDGIRTAIRPDIREVPAKWVV
jgi:hypothetical protein